MHISKLWILGLVFMALFNSCCKKEEIKCLNNDEFCGFISAEKYLESGPVINRFLKNLNDNLTDKEKLDRLVAWLNCKTCVEKAEILCVSCILTYHPQSEIKIRFKVNGMDVDLILDVVMDKPLRFGNFHD